MLLGGLFNACLTFVGQKAAHYSYYLSIYSSISNFLRIFVNLITTTKTRLMKSFLKYTAATVVGILLATAVFSIIGIVFLSSILISSSSTPSIKKNSVLTLSLSGQLAERSEEDNPLYSLLGSDVKQIGLENVLNAVKKAKTDDNIKGIYIQAGAFAGAEPASLLAIRKALLDFKKSGKFIYAYGDIYTQATYYLASVADKVMLNPAGTLTWHGMNVQMTYYKDLLSKVGVKAEVFRVGTFKSAVEPYFETKMSEANRKQMTEFTNDIWGQMVTDVSASRKLTPARLNQYADSVVDFLSAEDVKKMGFVDQLAYRDEASDELKKKLGLKEDDVVPSVSIDDMAAVDDKTPKDKSGNEIAVYYAYGEIVSDMQLDAMSSAGQISARKMCRDLKDLADNDDVKAVVLRVNSPGGDSYASEQINHAVKELKKKKPVVVSMGGYAASGGYYISSPASAIYAEPTTLTGSIGIFGLFFNPSDLLVNKLGLHFDNVKTNTHADYEGALYSRDMNPAERTMIQTYVNRGYDLFLTRVAEGRKMSKTKVNDIAQGRVWTGKRAVKLGLVDQLGGLNEAVAAAAKLAKIDAYSVTPYPAKTSFFDRLMENGFMKTAVNTQLQEWLGPMYDSFMYLRTINTRSSLQASLPYIIEFN